MSGGCACRAPAERPGESAAATCSDGERGAAAATCGDGDAAAAACSGGEAFALRVIGHSMAPEFSEGEILLIEPEGALRDGAYVLAQAEGEWTFRQLVRRGERWWLHPLNPAWPDQPLDDLSAVHGVVIQAAVPGRRRLTRHYV